MKKILIECSTCEGTGLEFVNCVDSAAKICSTCKGEGFVEFKYKEFIGRKLVDNVKRVYEFTPRKISSNDVFLEDGESIRFSRSGCTYEEWLLGHAPKAIREYSCPYADSGYKDNISEILFNCKQKVKVGQSVTSCEKYKDRNTCWDIYEEGIRK